MISRTSTQLSAASVLVVGNFIYGRNCPEHSARNNVPAAQNFLDMQPPDLSEVREALNCILGDTDRAGDIIDSIRDHLKNAPPRKEHFDLNEAINKC